MTSLMTTTSTDQFGTEGASYGHPPPLSASAATCQQVTHDGDWEESDASEDEEVEMNTMLGVRGMDDSDMFSDCEGNQAASHSKDDDDDDEECDGRDDGGSTAVDGETDSKEARLVAFVSDRVRDSSVPLVRPKASSPARAALSPLDEDEQESDETSVSSVGARGVALSLGTDSSMSQSSAEEEADDDNDDGADESCADDGMDPGYSGEREDFDEDDDEEERGEGVDDELSGLLETLGDRLQESDHEDSFESSERQLGVTLDRDDLLTIPKTKRVLSFNTLTALNSEICRIRDSPKRSKLDFDAGTNPLLSFSLGPPALSEDLPTLTKSLEFRLRRESPLVSSSDDEALDRQLEAELDPQDSESRDNSPVPLLTPPESPVMFEINGDRATICEWPSNLVVDSALVSTMNEVQPLSPTALEDFEREDADPPLRARASDLTPLIRGIAVRDA